MDASRLVALVNTAALQSAMFNRASLFVPRHRRDGLIQIVNRVTKRMLGYLAAEVVDRITPAATADPHEVVETNPAVGELFGPRRLIHAR
jgi:hypothetical protein